MIELIVTKRTDERLLKRMEVHYSQPKGFVGRNICYAILCDNQYYGHIVAGSATLHLPGRNDFFHMSKKDINSVINNIFFNCAPVGSKYPLRNFTTAVIKKFIHQSAQDWYNKYKDTVIGHETLIQPPRTGELYRRAGFCKVGVTKGYTCKRVAGTGTDDWSGKRVWDTKNLVPKIVMCRKYDER